MSKPSYYRQLLNLLNKSYSRVQWPDDAIMLNNNYLFQTHRVERVLQNGTVGGSTMSNQQDKTTELKDQIHNFSSAFNITYY